MVLVLVPALLALLVPFYKLLIFIYYALSLSWPFWSSSSPWWCSSCSFLQDFSWWNQVVGMQCLYPREVWLDSTRPHELKQRLLVPCGKCIACRINKKREWKERLLHEFQISENAYFLTLTYDNEHLPKNSAGVPSVCKEDCQKFIKRLRKEFPTSQIRYFLSSEYGEKDYRPHYHVILFNLPDGALVPCRGYLKGQLLEITGKGSKSMCNRHLSDIWKQGFVTIGYLTPERCGYTSDYYVDKQKSPPGAEPNFSLMSRRPGIGLSYCDSVPDLLLSRGVSGIKTLRGSWTKMPRIYMQHLLSPDERLIKKQLLYDKISSKDHQFEVNNRIQDSLLNSEQREYQISSNLKFHHSKKL